MESIHIFRGIHGFQNFLGVHVRRQRKLNENAVHVISAIQVIDDCKKLGSSDRRRRRDLNAGEAQFFAGRDFAVHVNFRSRIVADEYSGQPGANPGGGKRRNLGAQFRVDLVTDSTPAKDARRQKNSSFRESAMITKTEVGKGILTPTSIGHARPGKFCSIRSRKLEYARSVKNLKPGGWGA